MLPDSKRYAESESEHAEIAARQVTIARVLFEDDAPVWLVARHYLAPTSASDLAKRSAEIGAPLTEACVLSIDEMDDPVAVLAVQTQWSETMWTTVLRAIADDQERAMWVHARTGEVFAPYDGGVDVIFSSGERRDLYRQRFASWLSSRADGL